MLYFVFALVDPTLIGFLYQVDLFIERIRSESI